MGRTVYAEEHLLDYLKSLINETDVYSIGLILGQSTVLSDYVVHLVRTTPVLDIGTNDKIKTIPEEEFNDTNVTSIHDIDSNLVADHAKHVTRMLPGGMCVLGIFIVGPSDCLADTANVQKLETILTKIQKELMSNFYLFGNCNEQSLVLSYNSKTNRYTCKSIERSGVAAKSIDWKFKKKITKWHQLEAHVELDYLLPITDDRRPQTLKRQLQNILINVSEIIHSSLIVIEENARPLDDTLEDIYTQNEHKKVRKSEEEEENKILNVGVYSPYVQKPDPCVKSIVCNASMKLVGQLVCRTLVYQKATIREASAAIKQDILRSLASRLELHWDSLIQEENGSPEENVILHEPPRRVLFELPGSKVTLSEYLFPGEGLQNSLVLLKELLDIDIHESQINKDVEFEADPTEFCCQNYAKTIPIDSSKETGANSQLALYIAGIIVSFIIAAISILVYQLSSKESF